MLTLRLVFHLALRQAEGFARSVLQLLGMALSVPDHTTLVWTALHALDGYLTNQSAWLAATPSGTAPACGSAPRSPKGRPTSW